MDQNALPQITERLKQANNVLVTVSTNPSVDQLAACIGLTLFLNHLGKHGTAVFSGNVPSTIEFLKPDDTLEKNTDSLRDFIIALDKSKADKLRYKVEDKVVKIFITPYRTSISDKDLEFSQGDFNVDVVMALGVHERTELDKAIMDHGRILHDATVVSVNNKDQGNLGTINWVSLNASSLSEMMVELAQTLTKDPLDAQMATAFMTGIVAETDRFSNNKTSPRTMALASQLMAAGANQQLIASKLDAEQTPSATDTPMPVADADKTDASDGSLQISHEEGTAKADEPSPEPSADKPTSDLSSSSLFSAPIPTPKVEEITNVKPIGEQADQPEPNAGMPSRPSMALDPPTLGGKLTANSEPEHLQQDNAPDPLSLPTPDGGGEPPILSHSSSLTPSPAPKLDDTPAPAPQPTETLEEARQAVNSAIAANPTPQKLDPIEALGAQRVDLDTPDQPTTPAPTIMPTPPTTPEPPVMPPVTPVTPPPTVTPPAPMEPFGAPPDMNGVNPNTVTPVPPTILPPSKPTDTTASGLNSPTPPPPVPPPLMPSDDGANPAPPL